MKNINALMHSFTHHLPGKIQLRGATPGQWFILLQIKSKTEDLRNYSILVVTSKDSNNKTIDPTN